MANIYVRSGAGGAATGADWANAYLTLAAAATASAAGDDIWVAGDHAETQASAMTVTFPGTDTTPNRVFCASHSGSVPPVSADLLATGSVTTTGTSALTINGSVYIRGLIFNVGTGGSTASFVAPSNGRYFVMEACAINLVTSASGSLISLGNSNRTDFINTTVSFGAVGQKFGISGGIVRWKGASSSITGATIPTNLVNFTAAREGVLVVDGVDLSASGSGKTLVQGSAHAFLAQFINCRLGSSVTIASSPTGFGGVVDLINCDSGAVNYRNERYAYEGTLTTETTIARSGGASDGTSGYSWQVDTSANVEGFGPFECFPMAVWCDTTGGSKTITVELVNDGVTLTNAEVWAEASYLSSSSYPLASISTTGRADLLASATNLTTSTETWTTTGLTTPVKQKMVMTFTPQMKGWVRVVVKIARASSTIYIDPEPTLA